jgi:nucleotidyltransferase substrate binding protein (TIGR01987 family)
MILELSSFDNAILRLDEGIQRYQKDITDTQIRDGLIQRFEFTYELSHKMLKRFLESTSPSPANIDEMAFQDLIRTGNEQGLLLSDWTQWKKHREMRSRTSHTYDESVALQVVAEIPAFLQEARFLNAQLHARNK